MGAFTEPQSYLTNSCLGPRKRKEHLPRPGLYQGSGAEDGEQDRRGNQSEKKKIRATVHLEIFLQPCHHLSQIVVLHPMWKRKAAGSSIEQTQTNRALRQWASCVPGINPRDEGTNWKGRVHPIGFEVFSCIWVLCHCIIIILPLVQ